MILPEVNTDTMTMFLEEVARRHADEFVLMFLDSAGWHKSRSLTIPGNIRLIQLPPNSPQLNPVEHVWDEIREKWFSNKVFRNIDAIESMLMEALISLEGDQLRIRKMTAFDWIISNK